MNNLFEIHEGQRIMMHRSRIAQLVLSIGQLEALCKDLAGKQSNWFAQWMCGAISYTHFNMHLLDYQMTLNKLAADIEERDMLIDMLAKGRLA